VTFTFFPVRSTHLHTYLLPYHIYACTLAYFIIYSINLHAVPRLRALLRAPPVLLLVQRGRSLHARLRWLSFAVYRTLCAPARYAGFSGPVLGLRAAFCAPAAPHLRWFVMIAVWFAAAPARLPAHNAHTASDV